MGLRVGRLVGSVNLFFFEYSLLIIYAMRSSLSILLCICLNSSTFYLDFAWIRSFYYVFIFAPLQFGRKVVRLVVTLKSLLIASFNYTGGCLNFMS